MDGMGRMTKMTYAAESSLAPAAWNRRGERPAGTVASRAAVPPFIPARCARSSHGRGAILSILYILPILPPAVPARPCL